MRLVVVTLLVSTALSAGVLWMLTLIRDSFLGVIPMLPFDPHW